MSNKKYQTIVIAYEGDEIPVKGFCTPVLGCEVTRIAMGDDLEKVSGLEAQVEALEEMLSECTSHGELDSRLFNSFMEHAIKSK